MPVYTFNCDCGVVRDIVLAVETRDRLVECEKCHSRMTRRQVYKTAVRGDLPSYECPITGKRVEGRRQHEENLKRHGCRLIEPGETEGVNRSRKQRDDALEREVGETVEATIHQMPNRQREQLVAELQGGVTAEITRG